MIQDDDMHMGEYSQIGMDGLNNHEDTQYNDMIIAPVGQVSQSPRAVSAKTLDTPFDNEKSAGNTTV